MTTRILVLSDNAFLINAFHQIVAFKQVEVTYTCSPQNISLASSKGLPVTVKPLNVKTEVSEIIKNFDLVFSLHCKQLFPAELVRSVRCINVHPGYNPCNRGWFPQVFSILNKLKAGATIHEIDEQLDHGGIIARSEVKIEGWETSLDVYNKIQRAEVELLKGNMDSIINNTYKSFKPEEEGNVNLKQDFNALCKIDLDKQVTMQQAIDYLRAMTHGEYMNAWFTNHDDGRRVFLKIELKPE